MSKIVIHYRKSNGAVWFEYYYKKAGVWAFLSGSGLLTEVLWDVEKTFGKGAIEAAQIEFVVN